MLYSFSSIHVTWGCCQRSRACLHSVEVDRARHHAHIQKAMHANRYMKATFLLCVVPRSTIAACPRLMTEWPFSARAAHARTGRSWILRTPLDIIAPCKGCYDNLRFQGTSAGHMERSPHSAPCALCSWHGMQLFRVFFQKFSTELLTFSVILIEACMPGGGRVVDVGPA